MTLPLVLKRLASYDGIPGMYHGLLEQRDRRTRRRRARFADSKLRER
jgi:hypothetical protein